MIAGALREASLVGYSEAVCAVFGHAAARPYRDAGFSEHELLVLLRHDLTGLEVLPPVPAGTKVRRLRHDDWADLVRIDAAGFDARWRLGQRGIRDAYRATPRSRLRVLDLGGSTSDGVDGYAVTGRSGANGYLQRVAVDPARQRSGGATALVGDSLRWLALRGARQALVNTQRSNDAALRLYELLGFVRLDDPLILLHAGLERVR